MKKLFRYAGKYKKYLLLSPLIIILEVLLETFIPQLIARLVNLIDRSNGASIQMSTLLQSGGMLLLFALLSLLFGTVAVRVASIGAMGFAKNLRQTLFEKISHFSFSNTDKFSTASLVTRLTTDVNQTQNVMMMSVRMMVRAPIMFIMAFFWAYKMQPSLTTILLVAVPTLFVGMALIIKTAFPRFMVMMKKYDALNADVQENLTSIRVVKAYVREKFEKSKFNQTADDVQNAQRAAERVVILNSPLMQILMNGSVIAVLFLGGQKIIGGTMGTGDLIAFITYITQILMSLMMLSFIFVAYVMSKASITRINEVLDEEIDIKQPKNAIQSVQDGSIQFENVRFGYTKNRERDVIKNMSFTIHSGETIGIIGGTGSAKTTLVSLIPRLYDTVEGTVKVGNVNVKDYDTTALRNSVSMVLQKNVLFSGTIEDNMRWGDQNATEEEVIEALKTAQAYDFVTGFKEGLKTELGQGGVNVSGGQKQRLCIARALLKKPKILILDDATSAIDTATDAKIRQRLKTHLESATKIIIAQRISSIQDADRIFVLDDGDIVDVGTHDELKEKSEIYKEVYQSQQKGDE